jgi:hypothetical protein
MAVVKIKYVRKRSQIKAHLRYITHRKGAREGKITRPLFNAEGACDKPSAYRLIEAAPRGTVFFKIILSPDPQREDTRKDLDLWELTCKTLTQVNVLLSRDVPFVATVHADHTPLRHVHGFFLINGRLTKAEFAHLRALWKTAREEALRQRRVLDRLRENPRFRALTRALARLRPRRPQMRRRSYRPLRLQSGCTACGYGQFTGIPADRIACPVCHQRLTRDRTPGNVGRAARR